MSKHSIFVTVCLCAFVLGLTSLVVSAGPLTPPAGPVAPTPEIEPRIAVNATNTPGDASSLFRITQPGSYYLAGNIVGVNGKNGIAIASRGVTLDLMGFELRGIIGRGSLDGIVVQTAVPVNDFRIVNGTIFNWGQNGVDATLASIVVMRDVLAHANGSAGILVGNNSIIVNCIAELNDADGINVGAFSNVSNCTAIQNKGTGMSAGNSSTIINCIARSNNGGGMAVGDNSIIDGCTAGGSQGNGITAGPYCVIKNSISSFNSLAGIIVSTQSIISNCTATKNFLNGIEAGDQSTVSNCNSSSNFKHGIVVSSDCFVLDNNSSNNGSGSTDGIGIFSSGERTRIDGNSATLNNIGIDTASGKCLVIRNTVSGGTPYGLLGTSGPIINTLSSSIIASEHPWANFFY